MVEIVPRKGHGKLGVNGSEGMLGFGNSGKLRHFECWDIGYLGMIRSDRTQ